MKTSAAFILLHLFAAASALGALIVNEPEPITERVTIQLVVVADDDGLNAPSAFGNPTQQAEIVANFDTIWAQAGIDVEFKFRTDTWNNSFVLNGGGTSTRPIGDFFTIMSLAGSEGIT